MFDVITSGSATIDVFGHTAYSEMIKIKDPHVEREFIAFPCGEKILVKKLEFATGGGGTNTSVSMARLGLKVGYLGNIGKDATCEMVLGNLKKEKVKFIGTKSNHLTNYSYILESLEGDRTILVYKEASAHLDYNKINKNLFKAKWYYSSSLLGKSFETMKKLMTLARDRGIRVAFNPSNYQAEKGKKVLQPILSRTDLLILNKEEAELLLGVEDEKIEKLLLELHSLGPSIVAITNGKNGVFVFHDNTVYSAKPPKTKVKQTTGAGDAFASSFLAGLVKKGKIDFAIKLGMTNASSAVEHVGAKNGLLSYASVLKRMKKYPVKVIKKVMK